MPISAKPHREPRFATVNGRRMAYVDEGVGDAIVFQHGNPTSSYLWRNIMPHCAGLGRLIACDLIGMGRSDKLPDSGPERYSYHEQRDYLFALWEQLNLGDKVIVVLGRMLAPFSATGRHAPVAAEDQARLIAAILQHPTTHVGKTYPLFGPVELTHPEIAAIISHVIGKEVGYQQVPIEQFVEILSSRPKRSAQNTAMAMYSDPGAFTGGSAKTFVMQHLHEVAIDHSNGIFAGTNNYLAEIGGRQPMTVEEFVSRNRETFV